MFYFDRRFGTVSVVFLRVEFDVFICSYRQTLVIATRSAFPAIRKRALSGNGDYRNLAVLRFVTAAIRLIIKLASCPHYTERERSSLMPTDYIPRRPSIPIKPVMTTIKKLGSVETGAWQPVSGNRGKMRLLSFYRSESEGN